MFFAGDAGPAPTVEMSFVEGPCLYQITVGPGLTPEQVKAYATEF